MTPLDLSIKGAIEEFDQGAAVNPIQQAIEACEWVQLVFTDDTMAQERDPELWMPKMGEALTSLRSLQKEVEGVELPPLPEPDERTRKGLAFSGFAMEAYARTAVAAALGRGVVPQGLDASHEWPDAPASGFGTKLMPQVSGFSAAPSPEATQPTQAEATSEREALKDLLYAHHARPSCQEGALHVTRCRCVSCATERASAALATQQAVQAEPVAAQHRFRHPQKGTPDWSEWQPCKVSNRPAREIDSQGYEVEYRALGVIATPPAPGQVERDKEASELLDWLDAKNKPFKMGWQVGVAPAGNVVVKSVIYPITEPVSIRAAIRAARSSEGGSNG